MMVRAARAVDLLEKTMPDLSDTILRRFLGPTLQGAAARAVILLGAFAALGAMVAWLVH